MSDSDVPEDVQTLLHEHIESIEQLEILLLLHASPGDSWPTGAVVARLQLPEAIVADALQRLCTLGLLAAEPSGHYIYHPADASLARDVRRLAELYAHERAPILLLLSAHAIQRLRAGALSAFGAKKEAFARAPKKEGEEP